MGTILSQEGLKGLKERAQGQGQRRGGSVKASTARLLPFWVTEVEAVTNKRSRGADQDRLVSAKKKSKFYRDRSNAIHLFTPSVIIRSTCRDHSRGRGFSSEQPGQIPLSPRG